MKKYIVREGETMWSISKATGVRLNLLMAANPQVRDPNRLKPGMVLVIPELHKKAGTTNVEPKPEPAPTMQAPGPEQLAPGDTTPGFFGFVWPHVVQSGETWSDIAQKYNVSMEQLYNLNPSSQGAELQDGQVIYIPGMAGTTPQTGNQPIPPSVPGEPYGHGAPPYLGMQPMPEPYPYPYTYPQPGMPFGPEMAPYAPGQPQPSMPMGPHTHMPYRRHHHPHWVLGAKWIRPTPTGYWAFIPYQPTMYGLPPMSAFQGTNYRKPAVTWSADWEESCGCAEGWSESWSPSWSHHRAWDSQGGDSAVEFPGIETQYGGASDDAQPSERDAD
jgi:LysM repeat protein